MSVLQEYCVYLLKNSPSQEYTAIRIHKKWAENWINVSGVQLQ
ncbi:9276_t:CDS:2 [Funneliformis geosporum]|uniref:9276_t:CDS:1 n=1 Tax=Funneliformis geosporum TaxID=1117311 RepID=A0A9W4X3V9_9GLOM|nr:9276_t:CDS:2 [Funneliformis geosporum]